MYYWKGMTKISYTKALFCFENNVQVYLLHDNNTESLAESKEDLLTHYQNSGEFGITPNE